MDAIEQRYQSHRIPTQLRSRLSSMFLDLMLRLGFIDFALDYASCHGNASKYLRAISHFNYLTKKQRKAIDAALDAAEWYEL